MITVDEAARLLTGELEDCVAMLGDRLVGGGLRVESVRVAIGQTGEVAEDEAFLLSGASAGRPGWAVEVTVRAADAVPPVAGPADVPASTGVPLDALLGEPCTVLRGTDDRTAAALARAGVVSVGDLAGLAEPRLAGLRDAGGLRLLEAWAKAQLLLLPLPPGPWGLLGTRPLAELAGASPGTLRDLGLPSTVPDGRVDQLVRGLALLAAALDVAVLRTLTLDRVATGR